jgi:hypothetical protein
MSVLKVVENSVIAVYDVGGNRRVVNALEMYNYLKPEREYINWLDCTVKKLKREHGSGHLKDVYRNSAGREVVEYYFLLSDAKKVIDDSKTLEGSWLREYLADILWRKE